MENLSYDKVDIYFGVLKDEIMTLRKKIESIDQITTQLVLLTNNLNKRLESHTNDQTGHKV